MRHVVPAIISRRPTTQVPEGYPADGYTPEGSPSLPPITKRWPRLRDRGIEWTDMATNEEQRPRLMRVIHVTRPAR